MNAEAFGKRCSFVRARIVNQDDVVDDVHRDLAVSPFERLAGIICRKHDRNLQPVNHASRLRKLGEFIKISSELL